MTRYKINPGEYRHRITFQRQSTDDDNQNDYGEPIVDWQDVKPTKAAIYPISGKEFYAAETVNSEVTHKINMRYVKGLSPDMRVQFGDRHFDIKSIINFQESNRELQLLCKELI